MEKANMQRVFTPNPIRNVEDSDFELNGPIKIMLRIKTCLIVLFYVDNTESLNLADVWQSVGQQGVGNVFAACNLRLNPNIAQAFNELNMLNTSVHWAALKTVPFILVYQNGFPIGFYNGPRNVASILDFSLTLACRSDYREYQNIFGGSQAENNLEIKSVAQYDQRRTQSLDYTDPLRKYDPSDRPVVSSNQGSNVQGANFSDLPDLNPVQTPSETPFTVPSETRIAPPNTGGENTL